MYVQHFNFLFVLYRCVIAELFSEGTRLFDLSELLAYRNGTYDPNHHITEKIEDQHIRVKYDNLKWSFVDSIYGLLSSLLHDS